MYEEYFGLRRPPFKITPDTSLFFGGGKRGDILDALVYAIHRGEGIIKVVGEVGSGKTMLCRMLQLKLPETVETIYIGNPSVTPEDILFVIANELNLHAAKDASKHQVMHLLQDYLLQRHMENKQVVLFIEEAQGMPIDTLEEIRLLSNLETDQNKLLQIILFGQPELDENLAKKMIRQLRERITHSFNLSPLTRDEIHQYLNFRMREVGYSGPELIKPDIAKKIEQYSKGLLRRINIIADKVLLSAFSESTHNIKAKHVIAAVNDSSFNTVPARKSRLLWWLALLVLLAFAFAVFKNHQLFATDLVQSIIGSPAPATTIIEKPAVIEQSAKMEKQPMVETSAITELNNRQVVKTEIASEDPDPDTQITVASVAVAEVAMGQEVVTNTTSDVIENEEVAVEQQEPETESVENEQEIVTTNTEVNSNYDYRQWLDAKLQQSREWLIKADGDKISIQVLVRSKSAAKELAYFLQNDWPLDLDKTYLYEGSFKTQRIYRVFYNEFDSVSQGKRELKRLPESVQVNSPYLHSVYRMRIALL
jgi:type II secretory pathway predicted ATPase ExeA